MASPRETVDKVSWSGRVVAVQPRIRLTRSFDERSHSYLGYVLRINGACGGQVGEFLIAVGAGAHEKHRIQTGMELSGCSVPVEDPRKETATLYKTSGLKVVKDAQGETPAGPPFLGLPPELETYRSRGHRRLDARAYEARCTTCIWGCRMPVEMIIDQWNPSKKQNMLVQTLSRGMQQKVAIAVALIHEPKLLLLDEPTLGLDVEAAESMKQLLQDIAAEGRAVLLTTHQLNIAQQLSSRVAVIREGEIVAEQPTKELIRQFSGNTYTIEVRDRLDHERMEKLKSMDAAVTADKIVYSGSDAGLYRVLSVLEPLPLVRVEQDQADLTAIFLKLIKEPGHA